MKKRVKGVKSTSVRDVKKIMKKNSEFFSVSLKDHTVILGAICLMDRHIRYHKDGFTVGKSECIPYSSIRRVFIETKAAKREAELDEEE